MAVSPTTRHTFIARLKNRQDESAWEEFVAIYSPLLIRIAKKRGIKEEELNEVLQDVLLAIVKAMPTYDPREQQGSFRRWLMTIAKNKALNRLMRRSPEDLKRASSAVLESLATPKETRNFAECLENDWQNQVFVLAAEDVRKIVHPQTWTAFWMTAVEGRSPDVVAKELGMEIGTVYVARSRTLTKIRAWVSNQSARWEELK